MTEYRFYQLGQSSLSSALMGILPKALERGMRAHILCASPERMADLDARLWTDDPGSFLPHGVGGGSDDARQPILLSANDNAPANGAKLLILTDGANTDKAAQYELVCVMLNGADEAALAAGRAQWTAIKATGEPMSYWVQEPGKGWKQQA
jgi:DNA polymerase-3 subunit chi